MLLLGESKQQKHEQNNRESERLKHMDNRKMKRISRKISQCNLAMYGHLRSHRFDT
ncbi:hypothetical protein TRIATDRAFT_298881 [Trichoderma atroviride IMI 206040]|uniref:Uncharacterized protein n=1 Tax=Hypocrea atroviridis (strain ATCC 20476 / IMI 206040) TaxID=452589 RepID=G9NPT9_HYPAI|nr:uncharacterized protein TRIATDRAFT_298881 [Trichoderma atroviride IMI 206040]EHK47092.1 hypothetical protein TRIATDRAFT_298881 [Trichoderma atroviride IMI 206040]